MTYHVTSWLAIALPNALPLKKKCNTNIKFIEAGLEEDFYCNTFVF